MSTRRITIVFFDAGGGHRNAANALRSVIEQQKQPYEVELLNLQETLDLIDPFTQVLKVRTQDIYNRMLERGLTLGSAQVLKALHGVIRLKERQITAALEDLWRERDPEMVISVVPNFNRLLANSLRAAAPDAPFVTILTDLADYPPHFWIERESEYVICGTDWAAAQAMQIGVPEDRIFCTSGMILNPHCYVPIECDRREERIKLGLDPDLPTALLLFGGYGATVMSDIVRRLDDSDLPLQMIAICGKNAALKERLLALGTRKPLFVEGFTREVPRYMCLSDFFIGKPGPGSISEALHFHLPVVLCCNAWTLPQERFNAKWVEEKSVGIVLRTFNEIVPAMREMLIGDNLARYRANAAQIENRAIFEVPKMLEKIWQKKRGIVGVTAGASAS